MTRWIAYINKMFSKQISGSGLALFRIVYSCILLVEVLEIFIYRHLIYDPIPYIEMIEFSFGTLLIVWLFFIILLLLGLFSRVATLMNYLFSLIVISSMQGFEYHLDYSLVSINFILMFAPVSTCFSLDRMVDNSVHDGKISVIYPYLLLFMGVGLVYFDSFFWKLSSPMWTAGLGVWAPASFPQMTHHNQFGFLDQYPLILFLNYLTIAFEGTFLFIFRWKRLRVWILSIGLGLHIGIYIMFPIPWFAWGMISLYALLIPVSWIDKSAIGLRNYAQKLKQYFPYNFPVQNFLSRVPTYSLTLFSQRLKGKLWAFFVLGIGALSLLNIVYHIPPFRLKANPVIREHVGPLLRRAEQISRQTMGITSHPVFMDAHFDRYNHIICIVYQENQHPEEWLPLIDVDGRPGKYLTGRVWVNWTWRANGPDIDMKQLQRGIERYTAYWAFQNGIDLTQARFEVRVKKVELPTTWEVGFLKKQMEQTWQDAGYAIWQDRKFIPYIKDIESL